jgi:hypothetical protein
MSTNAINKDKVMSFSYFLNCMDRKKYYKTPNRMLHNTANNIDRYTHNQRNNKKKKTRNIE